MDGTPKDIFSQADRLRAIGLDVPVVTDIASRLCELGVIIPGCCYTVEQLRDAVLSLRKGGQT